VTGVLTITRLQLVPRLRYGVAIPPLTIHLHDVVLNWTRKTFPLYMHVFFMLRLIATDGLEISFDNTWEKGGGERRVPTVI
jgi:hypothetical protein